MKYFACAYYPEYWGRDRVHTDAELMRKAGVNAVRIGEFAWSHLEPSDGVYSLDWLEEALAIFDAHHIKVILCTPTACAPPWLVKKHPEILKINKEGRRAWVGVRQHTCYTSPVYRRYAKRIVEKLCEVAAPHSHILGWQIDNEMGHTLFGRCHCPVCQQEFRSWLKNRYQTVHSLNDAWGNTFWSQCYTAWDEISLGDMEMHLSASHVLDSLRFHSEQKISYLNDQVSVIRSRCPNACITTNSPSGIVDRYRMVENLDRASPDIYPVSDDYLYSAYMMDLYRGLKKQKPIWVLETGIGGQGVEGVPHHRRLRSQLWHFFARGAEMVSIFRWRTCLSGYERDLMGILGFSGVPGTRYAQLKECIGDIHGSDEILKNLPLPEAKVGLCFDYENHWAFSGGHWRDWKKYEEAHAQVHRLLTRSGVLVDIISPKEKWADYRVLIVPSFFHVTREMSEKLHGFVEEGGILIMSGATGMFSENAIFLTSPLPAHLQELLGVAIRDQLIVRDLGSGKEAGVQFSGEWDGQSITGSAFDWLADMELHGGRSLMSFDDSSLKGQPAVVENRVGKGIAIYMGMGRANDSALQQILNHTLLRARISKPSPFPEEVEYVERGPATFFINHSSKNISFEWDRKAIAKTGSFVDRKITLEPYDVCVLTSP